MTWFCVYVRFTLARSFHKRTNMQLPLQAVTQCLPHNTPDLLTMFGKQHEQRRHCATVLWKCLNAFKTF